MILPLAYDMITLKTFLNGKCIMNRRKRDEIKFGMTSIPSRHALLGVTLRGTCYWVLPFEAILLLGKLASLVSKSIIQHVSIR